MVDETSSVTKILDEKRLEQRLQLMKSKRGYMPQLLLIEAALPSSFNSSPTITVFLMTVGC